MYRLDVGDLPTTQQGLEALREAPSDLVNPDKWKGKYLEDPLPQDSWGNEMKVECPSEDEIMVISAGRDGNFGTDDDLSPETCRAMMNRQDN